MNTRTRLGWNGTLAALAAALLLLGTGVALAKPPGGKGRPDDVPGKGRGWDGGPGKGGNGCDAVAVAAARAVVDVACPCAGMDDGAGGTVPWRNHGRYVRCVKHTLRDALRAAGIRQRCVRSIVPCAARSACGKKGAIACGVTTPGTCVGGTCSHDPATSCTLDSDCDVRSCSVTRSEECAAQGGVPVAGSCCTGSPSGAFLE